MKIQAKRPATPAGERAKRIKDLNRITQDEYEHLLAIVRKVVPRAYCDPTEALSEGLLAALRTYDGNVKLTTYVAACAMHYAIRTIKKYHRYTPFADLPRDGDTYAEDSYLDRILPSYEDPRYIEGVSEVFIRRIEEILGQMKNCRLRHARPTVIALAQDVLELLRENANLGKGIGIDEYENAPLKVPDWPNQRPQHNIVEPRARIHEHLPQTLGADKYNVRDAMQALRISTRQALHEGWLE